MNRSDLIARLDLLAPAVTKNETLIKLTHYWFTGDRVIADNTIIHMQAPLKTPFAGGVPGMRLLGLLKASRFKECKFESGHSDELLIKAVGSSTKLSFAMLPATEARAISKPRTMDKDNTFTVNRKRLERAIGVQMLSVAKGEATFGMSGVTFIGRGNVLDLYSTNDAQLSHSQLKITSGSWKGRAVVPVEFLRTLLAVTDDGAKEVPLEIESDAGDKSYIMTKGKYGIVLVGSLPVPPATHTKPMNFDKIMEVFYPPEVQKKLVPIPTKMELVLERASIIESDSADEIMTDIEVAGTKATFSTKSKKGDAWDEVELASSAKASITVSPKRVREGIGTFVNMAITDRAFIMEGNGAQYFVVPGKRE
jgi:hypothetical protein